MVNDIEGDSNNKAVPIKLISQKCFPDFNTLNHVPELLETVENESVKNILKLDLCCGFRIVELMNSFIYYGDNGKLIIQGPMEKSKISKHKSPRRGFWGTNYLNYKLGHNDEIWKSVELMNPFNLNMDWLHPYISPSALEPIWPFKGKMYHGEYMELKKMPEFEVFYFRSRHLLPLSGIKYIPGFHWYRKLFCAGAVDKQLFKDSLDLVNYMHWGNPAMVLSYFRLYHTRDIVGANEMIHNMKSFSMGKGKRDD